MSKSRQGGSGASRDRLEEMITMVQSYRGWSQKQVAEALDRNVHALVPDSGNPKLDLVVKLSNVLDWPLEMVVADLKDAELDSARGARAAKGAEAPAASDAKSLIRRAWEECEAERWHEVLRLTEPESLEGFDGESRGSLLYFRQYALENMGQYLAAIDCCRSALESVGGESDSANRLRSALAYLLYVTGSLDEADALAASLVLEIGAMAADERTTPMLAFAHLVRGLASRSLGVRGNTRSGRLLDRALTHLEESARLFSACGGMERSSRNAALAVTARCAAREVGVLRGDAPEAMVDDVLAQIGECVDVLVLDNRAAESLGWCCIFAAGVILANPAAVTDSERKLAILTNKADEVAERIGHWALRERLFAIEHLHRVLAADSGQGIVDWNLDDEDVRTLMGTMGRFPRFRRLGWTILRAVREERKDGGS